MTEALASMGVVGGIVAVVYIGSKLVGSMLETVTAELVNNIRERFEQVDARLDKHEERIDSLEKAA